MRTVWLGLLIATGAFAAGFMVARYLDEPAPMPDAGPPAAGTGQPGPAPSEADPMRLLVEGRAWGDLVEFVESAVGTESFPSRRAALLDVARTIGEQGDGVAAARILELFTDANPFDNTALIQLAEQYQRMGRLESATRPYIGVLAYPEDAAAAQAAEDGLRRVVSAFTQPLIGAGRAVELATFYGSLLAQAPGRDDYRLELARWEAHAGRLDAAERVLSEVGDQGVTQAELEAVRQHIRWRRAAVDVVERDGHLVARVTIGGRPSSLLVDTGASITAIDRQVLIDVGAVRLPGQVEVQTAGGRVTVDRYRVRDLAVGSVQFDSIEVLALDEGLGATDGLLGMDVLRRTGIPDHPDPGDGLARSPGKR